jgi:rubrerythrin
MVSFSAAVENAIQWEKYARDSYLAWAKQTDDADSKQLFLNLARMEQKHVDLLGGLDLKDDLLKGFGHFEVINLSEGMSPYHNSSTKNFIKIVRYAISTEGKAAIRYQKLAEATGEGTIKALFLQLSSEVRYHETILTTEYNRLLEAH